MEISQLNRRIAICNNPVKTSALNQRILHMDRQREEPPHNQVEETLRRNPLKTTLTAHEFRKFKIAKLFKDTKSAITSLDFNQAGTQCVTTSQKDESLHIYNCMRGTREQVLYSKKYGCSLAKFAGQDGCIVHGSTKINDTLRYLSYETNQYVRYFVGHEAWVTSLEASPANRAGLLLSASLDGSVKMWDFGAQYAAVSYTPNTKEGVGPAAGARRGLCAAYDVAGTVMGAAVHSRELQLFDVREVSRGPFMRAAIEGVGDALVARVQFVPPAGEIVLVTLTDGRRLLVDAFELRGLAELVGVGATAEGATALDLMVGAWMGQNTTATPDGAFVVAGGEDGGVAYWDVSGVGRRMPETLRLSPSGVWEGSHGSPVSVCAFNPEVKECVTAADTLAFWA